MSLPHVPFFLKDQVLCKKHVIFKLNYLRFNGTVGKIHYLCRTLPVHVDFLTCSVLFFLILLGNSWTTSTVSSLGQDKKKRIKPMPNLETYGNRNKMSFILLSFTSGNQISASRLPLASVSYYIFLLLDSAGVYIGNSTGESNQQSAASRRHRWKLWANQWVREGLCAEDGMNHGWTHKK